MITMYDAVTTANLPADAEYIAVYLDGQFANEAEVRARFPHATLLPITVLPENVGECCDCEVGDLTIAQAEAWVSQRLAAGVRRPVVYANSDRWANQGLLSGLAHYGSDIRRWVAAFPGTGANVPPGFDAHQYSTGDIDTSVCLDDFFTTPKPKPVTRWASVELQVEIGEGATGVLRVAGTFDANNGVWGFDGRPGENVDLKGGSGQWRHRALDYNAGPIGG